MDVYIARQPIFDKYSAVYGYELLYRQSSVNAYTGTDDDQATADLIYNSFLVFGLNELTEGTRAFINFSKGLINSELPLLLPNQRVVIEVLERERATQEILDACKKMRSLGYMLALDDFVFDEEFLPLMDIADIIKVEFPAVSHEVQRRQIRKYKSKVRFLAEKIETREDYQAAVDLGYDYFQGYFFSKPVMINTKEIASLNMNLFRIIEELNTPEPSLEAISGIIQSDLGLSFKLLKLINSAYMGTRNQLKSIRQALAYLGLNETYQWVSLMLLRDLQNVENAELIKLSLLRGRLMNSLAGELNADTVHSEYFFTGMFSFVDILLNKSMADVLVGLPLPVTVKQALLGQDNVQRRMLNCIIDFERADWNAVENNALIRQIGTDRFMRLYVDALKWVSKLRY